MADAQLQLEDLRKRIDQLDAQIQELINKRVEIAKAIAHIKSDSGSQSEQSFYRPERENQILRAIIERNNGPLSDEQISHLFREIMSATLAAEAPISVGFLGPQGTYTQAAALKHFGHAVQTRPLATIAEVFRAVEQGNAHYGLVPVENSIEGVVTHTLDTFIDSPLKICGEVVLRIRHQLLSKVDSLDKVTEVLAHSQSLAQCRRWLTENMPSCGTVAVNSNAEAAQQASQDESVAAIASSTAAEIYKLNVLAADIEDDPGNTTRFLVIGKNTVDRSGNDKTSVLVSSPNRPGALHRLLGPLAKHGVSMTRIESRPSRKGLWDYVFFIDMEGHLQDSKIQQVLEELEAEAAFVKLLGAYPRAIL